MWIQKQNTKQMTAVPIKRKRRSLPWAAATNKDVAKAYFGGTFPLVRGRKYTYPPPSAEAAWMVLVRAAIKFDKARHASILSRTPIPTCPDPRLSYILFHARPLEIKRRAIRVKHRKQHGLKVGDKDQVHHKDPTKMTFKSTVVLTHCEHKKEHGQVCDEDKTKLEKKKKIKSNK